MIKQIEQDLIALYDHKKHRLSHVYGVRDTALYYGKQFGLDLKKLELASLLHDITKYASYDTHVTLIESYYDNPNSIITEYNPKILHAFSAVVVAVNDYGITDKDVLHAIQHHTVGAPQMSRYEEVIFLSDYIEPNRTYSSCVEVRNLATYNWTKALYKAMDDSIIFHEKQGNNVPQTAYLAREYYKQLLEESE